jgi:hypothetical protein
MRQHQALFDVVRYCPPRGAEGVLTNTSGSEGGGAASMTEWFRVVRDHRSKVLCCQDLRSLYRSSERITTNDGAGSSRLKETLEAVFEAVYTKRRRGGGSEQQQQQQQQQQQNYPTVVFSQVQDVQQILGAVKDTLQDARLKLRHQRGDRINAVHDATVILRAMLQAAADVDTKEDLSLGGEGERGLVLHQHQDAEAAYAVGGAASFSDVNGGAGGQGGAGGADPAASRPPLWTSEFDRREEVRLVAMWAVEELQSVEDMPADMAAWGELINLIALYRETCSTAARAGAMDDIGGQAEQPGRALEGALLLPLAEWAVSMGGNLVRTGQDLPNSELGYLLGRLFFVAHAHRGYATLLLLSEFAAETHSAHRDGAPPTYLVFSAAGGGSLTHGGGAGGAPPPLETSPYASSWPWMGYPEYDPSDDRGELAQFVFRELLEPSRRPADPSDSARLLDQYHPPMVGQLTEFLHAPALDAYGEPDAALALKKQQHEWRHLLRRSVSAVDDGRGRDGGGFGGGGGVGGGVGGGIGGGVGGADGGHLLGTTADVARCVAREEMGSIEARNTLLSIGKLCAWGGQLATSDGCAVDEPNERTALLDFELRLVQNQVALEDRYGVRIPKQVADAAEGGGGDRPVAEWHAMIDRAIFYCGEGQHLIERQRAEVFCLALDTFRCVAAVEGAPGGGKGGMSAEKVREYRAWLWGQAMKLDETVWANAPRAGSTDDFEELLKTECASRVEGGGGRGSGIF